MRMRCCMFKGGGGVGSWYIFITGAAEYVPADFDGSVGKVNIDVDKTRAIRPDKINDALRWLIDILGLLTIHTLRPYSPPRSLTAKCLLAMRATNTL